MEQGHCWGSPCQIMISMGPRLLPNNFGKVYSWGWGICYFIYLWDVMGTKKHFVVVSASQIWRPFCWVASTLYFGSYFFGSQLWTQIQEIKTRMLAEREFKLDHSNPNSMTWRRGINRILEIVGFFPDLSYEVESSVFKFILFVWVCAGMSVLFPALFYKFMPLRNA